jgi:hypothetical protein
MKMLEKYSENGIINLTPVAFPVQEAATDSVKIVGSILQNRVSSTYSRIPTK